MCNTTKFNWETPQDFFDILNREFQFTLDPCAEPETAKCAKYYTKEDDGLTRDWTDDIVFMNPPYDRNISAWVKKAYDTAQKGGFVVALIQGRSTDTRMWHDYVMKADEIRFIRDRLYFGQNGIFKRANMSSVVVVFTPKCQGPPRIKSIGNGIDK